MIKPTIILATSNGIGMGHLARATAIAEQLKPVARPILVSLANAVAEIPSATGISCEYVPGETRGWMPRHRWDKYFRDRLVAIADETGASVISFDGVVPYSGFIAIKLKRPDLKIVWVRRGFWQKNLLRFVLPLQSRFMDLIIEPGDIAREYDRGPTSIREDAHLTSPVSLYYAARAQSREDARRTLGLDITRPAILVQLGTGDSDMNEKMRAALTGLLGWRGLQVVLTKNPVDSKGASLAPLGLDIRVLRYFPLVEVLAAFDAAIAATGYNSVHELLPAQIPTVLISNIRGTDDQDSRAKWCHDNGFALRADHTNLKEITSTVSLLCKDSIRTRLRQKCKDLGNISGSKEIAGILTNLASMPRNNANDKIARYLVTQFIHNITMIYHLIKPNQKKNSSLDAGVCFSQETNAEYLRTHIKAEQRFEHMIVGASQHYINRRHEIASKAYGA